MADLLAPPDVDDRALVLRVQAGDMQAYAEIWQRYHVRVSMRIYRLTGDRNLADDLKAEVFTKALKNIGSFTWQGHDFVAWLYTIAGNLVADHLKSAHHRRDRACDFTAWNAPDYPDCSREGDPETTAEIRLASLQVLAAMAHLTPEQREVVSMRYLAEMTTDETARAIGKNVGATKALLYRALVSLRRILAAGELSAAVPRPRGREVPSR